MKVKNESINEARIMNNVIYYAESIIRKNLEEEKSDNIYYQYTKMQTLDAILNGGCLRATDMKYLNDSLEYQLGINTIDRLYKNNHSNMSIRIREKLEKYKNEYEKDEFSTFSISFCEDGDLLSQWITYAKEGGVSIGFDFSIDSLYWGQKIDKSYYLTNVMKNPLKVIYVSQGSSNNLKEEQIRKIKSIMKEITNAGMTTNLEKMAFYMVLCYIKNSEFVTEKEHRIVSVPCYNAISSGDEKKRLSEIKTTLQDSHVFRPYIELFPIYANQEIAKLPIAEIIVGPASNQKSIFRSLVYKLEHSFTESVKIEKPSKGKLTERRKRYDKIVNKMKSQNPDINDIDDRIHFCENWGLIIRTSESSYVF